MAGQSPNQLRTAMQYVGSAIELDNSGKVKEAYHSYLNSMLFVVNTLRDQLSSHDFQSICNKETTKLLTLVQNCQERAIHIISSSQTNASRYSSTTSDTSLSLDASEKSKFEQKGGACKIGRDVTDSGALDRLVMSLPSPPVKKSPNLAPRRTKSVNSVYKIQNRQMFNAYQRRLSIQRQQDKNFNAFRKIVEDMMVEKARQKVLSVKLAERREKLRLKAEERFRDRTGSRAIDAAQEKKIYAKILEFEQETAWPQKLREQLAKAPEDIKLIEEIVKSVLGAREHPLGQQMAEMQYALYKELSILVGDFSCPVFKLEEFDLFYHGHDAVVDSKNEDGLEPVVMKIPTQGQHTGLHDTSIEHEEKKVDAFVDESLNLNKNHEVRNLTEVSAEDLVDGSSQSRSFTEVKPEENHTKKNEENILSGESKESVNINDRFALPIQSEQFDIEFHNFEESMIEDLDSEDFELLPKEETATGDLPLVENDADDIGDDGAEPVQTENVAQCSPESNSVDRTDAMEFTHEIDQNAFVDESRIVDQSSLNVDDSECNVPQDRDENDRGYKENLQSLQESGKPANSDSAAQEHAVEDTLSTEKCLPAEVNEEEDVSEQDNLEDTSSSTCETEGVEDASIVEKDVENEASKDDKTEVSEASVQIQLSKEHEEHGEEQSSLTTNITDSAAEVYARTGSEDQFSTVADTDRIESYSKDGDSELDHANISSTKNSTSEKYEVPSYRAMPDSVDLRGSVEKVVKDIHSSLSKLHSLLIITYDELDLPVGRDQSYAAVESMFFKPLWQWVNLVFRRLNVQKEVTLYDVVKKRWHCGPTEFSVRDKFALTDNQDDASSFPYKCAVEELRKITSYSSPLDKLECIVLTTKLICQCVADYWIKKGESEAPSIGCDDILPILSYVIVRAALPQLVSECHAMEEFIQESYLLGEEGYCLTTLATALAYSLSLKET